MRGHRLAVGGLVGAGPAGGAAGATWSARPRRRGSSATRCSCGRHDESDGNRQLLWSLGHKFSSGASGLALATMVAFSAPDALAEATRQDTSVVETQTTTISEEIKGPASVVKDCRTDSPDLQTVYWVSSRSVGQNPTLYAIDKDGKIIGDEYQVQTRNVGQEEIVFVHRQRKGKKEDFIVLADTSNKFKNRDQLAIYEIAPSVPTAADDQRTKVDVEREIDFEFPTAAQEDPRSEKSSSYTIPVGPTPKVSIQYPQEDYDTAAIIVIDDTLWAFSKRSLGSSTALYRLPVDTISPYVREKDDKTTHTLEFVQEFGSGAPACGADVSTDGTRLALLTRETIFLFDLTVPEAKLNPISSLIGRIPVPKSAGLPVGITWDDKQTMILLTDANELTRIRLGA